ncbi:UDP-2,3-diacylglucosamine diphosphatase [Parendozoicomonas haliclonae]|uniref:UDP-2,3-diacylglucosamine hydrolase n=1 Tax=Parendozoicomonas haliclonae TaxID=1960125 RepID=A0A1X7AKW2_9GAMM|nr:UDP-2,3-diacylglucosamine hydrolase [Parendozoicomonas haliclonae]
MRSLFISDLHLTPGRPDITRAFLRFMEQEAPTAQSLYILGDFFEYWIGDDVMDEFHHQIAAALRKLSDSGTSVYFMHGNRDFLIGKAFCREAGCTLLPDPSVITLGNDDLLLMHGDSLCTSDKGYMRFRKVLRNALVQKLFLSLPASRRRNTARKLRDNSMAAMQDKPMSLMDVTPEAVEQALDQARVSTLIHGHTHRAHIHALENQRQRIVLGDWDKLGWYLIHDDQKPAHERFEMINFPIAS